MLTSNFGLPNVLLLSSFAGFTTLEDNIYLYNVNYIVYILILNPYTGIDCPAIPYPLFAKAKLEKAIKDKKKIKREEMKRRHYAASLLPSGVS